MARFFVQKMNAKFVRQLFMSIQNQIFTVAFVLLGMYKILLHFLLPFRLKCKYGLLLLYLLQNNSVRLSLQFDGCYMFSILSLFKYLNFQKEAKM